MPRYPVLKPGFFAGRMYDPNGKRRILTTDKPFTAKNKPSWVGDAIGEETDRQRKAREKKESADVAKRADDKKELDAVTFVEEPSLSGPVETL